MLDLSDEARVHLSTDGALRGDGNGAAGMAILVHRNDGQADVVCRAGKMLGKISSALVAELLALEWALLSLEGMIEDISTEHVLRITLSWRERRFQLQCL